MAQEALITDYFYGVNPSDSTIFTVPSRFMCKIVCRLRLNEVSRQ